MEVSIFVPLENYKYHIVWSSWTFGKYLPTPISGSLFRYQFNIEESSLPWSIIMTSGCTSYDSWSDIRHNILIQGESFCNNKCPSSFKSSSNHWPSCCWGCRCQAVRIDKTKAAYLYTYINSIYWCIKFRKLYGRGVNCFSSVCLQKSHQSISRVTRIVCIIDLNQSKNHEGR